MNILCLIPARSGSKGIKNKNILEVNGFPMLVWCIKQAQESKYSKYMKIVLSTDSEEYRKIGLEYGAEVPFLRPIEISGDLSTDQEFIEHAVDFYQKDNYEPDFILQLRPTYPTRNVKILDECLDIFLENRNEYDSLRTIVPFEKSPYKMYKIQENILKPLFEEVNNTKEPYNQCRQVLPKTYLHNGYIDILNTNIVKNGTISGDKIYPYIMNKNEIYDIDTLEDLEKIKF
jgi:CMP-N,N'-diacetyllegionaminic acid synthase